MRQIGIIAGVMVLFVVVGLNGPLLAQEADTAEAPPSDIVLAAPGAQKWALLIGIDDYAELDDNRYCSRDVGDLRGRLIAGGFSVTNVFLLNDDARLGKYLPSKANIERQMALVPALGAEDDLLVVVLCGHAMSLDGKSYFCPMDAQREGAEKTLVAMSDIYRLLTASPVAQKLLIVDVARRSEGQQAEGGDAFLQSLEQPPAGITILASCRSGESSAEDEELGRGVFMHFLIRGLEGEADQPGDNADKRISLAEWVAYVQTKTAAHAANATDGTQTPTLYGGTVAELDIAGEAKFTRQTEAYPTVQVDPGAAAARLEAMVKVNPQSLGAYNRALEAYGHADVVEAIEYCNDSIRYDPANIWAHVLRASCYCAYGDFTKALEDYKKLGIPLPCSVSAKKSQLKMGPDVVVELQQGDRLYITKAKGEWLWAQYREGNVTKEGWIDQKDVE